MSPAKLALSIAAGIVLGGLCLCGGVGLLMSRPFFGARPSAASRQDEREHLMAAVKVIGLGALLYSNDNDDQLPEPSTFREKVRPYVLRQGQSVRFQEDIGRCLDRFEASFPGGSVSQVPNPKVVPMGWIRDDSGYSIVYLDGTAEWRPKQVGR